MQCSENSDSRIQKAQKIVALVGEERFHAARRVLEIGCGSGVIASTLATMGAPDLEVHAVDVVDSRIETGAYTFQLVDGTTLPYHDGQFDIVISNHVIEHVGQEAEQLEHLAEIRRVTAEGGSIYLAVPNRWRLIEPHYRLPLLSWLPHPACDLYVKWSGKGSHYDCEPLAHAEALALFASADQLRGCGTISALRATLVMDSENQCPACSTGWYRTGFRA